MNNSWQVLYLLYGLVAGEIPEGGGDDNDSSTSEEDEESPLSPEEQRSQKVG